MASTIEKQVDPIETEQREKNGLGAGLDSVLQTDAPIDVGLSIGAEPYQQVKILTINANDYTEGMPLRDAFLTLGITDADPSHLNLIDAYNKKMVQYSPANKDLTGKEKKVTHSDVMTARRVLNQAFRSLSKLYEQQGVRKDGMLHLPKYMLPERPTIDDTLKEEMQDAITQPARFSTPQASVLESDSGLILKPDEAIPVYDAYMQWFSHIRQRLESVKPAVEYEMKMTKEAMLESVDLNEAYFNPEVKRLKKRRKMGFESQRLPGAQYVEVSKDDTYADPFTARPARLIRRECLENKVWDMVFIDSRQGELQGSVLGHLSIDAVGEYRLGTYHLGEINASLKRGLADELDFKERFLHDEFKSGKGLKYDFTRDVYKKAFGFDPPTSRTYSNFLAGINGLDRRSHELKRLSPKELTYPLTDEIIEAYQAATDSGLFERVEFIELEKVEDPILNGVFKEEVLGSKLIENEWYQHDFPIAWWV